ncbi:MAG: monovalent cation/H+ antiporter complex subunit F [Actinomycetota bacterium]
MNTFILALAAAIMVNAFLCLYQGVKGPAVQDRVISINIVNTKTLVVLLLAFYVLGDEAMYLDIAIVYALLNFVVTIAVCRYLETERESLGRSNT